MTTSRATPPQGAGLYVHVPFCRTRCAYCAFFSQTDLSWAPRWVDAVLREAYQGRPREPVVTSYVGGGTPSVLPREVLLALLDGLRDSYDLESAKEITIEANPDDVDPGFMRVLREAGVSRLSLGVQSFSDEELRFLGRRHDAAQARAALWAAMDAGFASVSVDLMYGFRGQRRDRWLKTLEEAISWGPGHLSCYQLSVEPGTPLARAGLTATPEGKEYAFFVLTSRRLTDAGYRHYEVSNFALPGHESQHNLGYWRHLPYRGLGPSAHSFDGARRWWNTASVPGYIERLECGESPVGGEETLTEDQVLMERLMLGFRTSEGVECALLQSLPGGRSTLDRLEGEGLLVVRGDRALPTLRGLAVADRLPLAFLG